MKTAILLLKWFKQWKIIKNSELNVIQDISLNRLKLYQLEQTKLEIVSQKLLEYKTGNEKLQEALDEYEMQDYWNNKYPKANIVYECRSLPFSNKLIPVPVNLMITPYDPEIRDDLIRWGLYKTGEDHETLVPKIDRKIYEKYYKYNFDEKVWNVPEVWEFFFEMLAKGFDNGFDCDSFANMKASYYRAVGVPDWKVRCVAGDTSIVINGEVMGHLTTYVLSMKTGKFHHLNSTYGQLWNTISEYPTHKDAEDGKDDVGIVKVWFSYNDKSAFHDFIDTVDLKNIKIKKIMGE